MRRLLDLTGLVLLCLLAHLQLRWLGQPLGVPIQHGANEDWDWQLTLYEATRRSVAVYGELPAWTPYTQGGVPLWANPEFPLLYPGFWPVFALGTDDGLKVFILLHLWLMVAGFWAAGRQLGLSPVASHLASLFLLGSAFVPGFIQYGHVMFLPLGWLPLAWVAQQRGRVGLAALCLALTFLAGGHYLLLYGALWLALDGVLRGLDPARLTWLGAALALNGLLLGVHALAWPVGLLLLLAVLAQRPRRLRGTLPPVLAVGALAGLLLAPKLATAPALFARAERLAAQDSRSVADAFDWPLAWQHLTGAADRLSGHEGQNVFWSGWPVVLGLLGLVVAVRTRPHLAVLGLAWWCVGWGGATPFNLLELLHRVPGYDHLRVVERYSLVWTPFLGWGAGVLLDLAWEKGRRVGALLVALPLAAWLWVAVPQAATLERTGAGAEPVLREDPGFRQVACEHSNYHGVLRHEGCPNHRTTAWLADPGPVRADGGPQAWLADGAPVAAAFTMRTVRVEVPRAGLVVVNQNAFEGWTVDGRPAGSAEGLLAAELGPGVHTFRYEVPGLRVGLWGGLTGLVLVGWSLFGARAWRPGREGAPGDP